MSDSPARAVLAVEHLSIARGGRAVLDDVSLVARAGQVHVVMGPNGAGKSSLLAALLGEIAFRGSVRRSFKGDGRIGFVPQAFATDRTLPVTVSELFALTRQRWPVCFGVRPSVLGRASVALARVGLAGFEQRRLGELSGGELRRVLLANALEPAPELLLLDEPSSGMDRESRRVLETLVRRAAHEDGAAVLMISHDAGEVRRVADHVTWLRTTVRASGPPSEVLAERQEELSDG